MSLPSLEQAFSQMHIDKDVYDTDTDTDMDVDLDTMLKGQQWWPPQSVVLECIRNSHWYGAYQTHFTYGCRTWQVKMAWHPDEWSGLFKHILLTTPFIVESPGVFLVVDNTNMKAWGLMPDQPKKPLHSNAGSWTDYKVGTSHNPLCSVESEYCSAEMSPDVPDLCQWHRVRMGKHLVRRCSCQEFVVCLGDSTGRRIFNDYYLCHEIPVINSAGVFYCCSGCCNTDDYTHTCGDMYVCQKHIALHTKAMEYFEDN